LRTKLPERPGPCAAPLPCLRLPRPLTSEPTAHSTVRGYVSTASGSAQQATPGCRTGAPQHASGGPPRHALMPALGRGRGSKRQAWVQLGRVGAQDSAGEFNCCILHVRRPSELQTLQVRAVAAAARGREHRGGVAAALRRRQAAACTGRTELSHPLQTLHAANSSRLACACADTFCAPLGYSLRLPAQADAGVSRRQIAHVMQARGTLPAQAQCAL